MDGATTTSTGSNNSAPGVNNSNGASSFLNLGSLGSNQAVVGGMGLFSSGVGAGEGLGSSFGTSFGNGFTNDSGSANPSFDLNDFPSLGGGAASGAGSTVAGSDNGLAAALRQQQQLLQQQMMQAGISAVDKSSNLYRLAMSSGIANGTTNNFNMTTEDFPALGTSGDLGGHTEGGSTLDTASLTTGSGGILDSGGSNQLDYTGLIGSTGVTISSGIQQGSQPRATSTGTQSGSGVLSSAAVGSSGNSGSGGGIGGDYGLLGLLSVIRMTDADRNRLALGSDLTVLGLNLNSPDVLHSTFGGPFSDKPATKDPHYQVR
jgi:CCR4-NOT transcription complex subunit 2